MLSIENGPVAIRACPPVQHAVPKPDTCGTNPLFRSEELACQSPGGAKPHALNRKRTCGYSRLPARATRRPKTRHLRHQPALENATIVARVLKCPAQS